jgi:hypothetical protein
MSKLPPAYVTFEQAKWLKEKGFDVEVEWAYSIHRLVHDSRNRENKNWNNESHVDCSAPEQHQVVEWLRVNHGIWVSATVEDDKWTYGIKKTKNQYGCLSTITLDFNSPQEAYSAAFDYIKANNMI